MDITSFKKAADKVLRAYVKKKIYEAKMIASWPRPKQLVSYIEDVMFS